MKTHMKTPAGAVNQTNGVRNGRRAFGRALDDDVAIFGIGIRV